MYLMVAGSMRGVGIYIAYRYSKPNKSQSDCDKDKGSGQGNLQKSTKLSLRFHSKVGSDTHRSQPN